MTGSTIAVSEAVQQLKEAGYCVEVTAGIVYVRVKACSMPDRLYTKQVENIGHVSARKVKRLLNLKQTGTLV